MPDHEGSAPVPTPAGVRLHNRPNGGGQCDYFAEVTCNKCGWVDKTATTATALLICGHPVGCTVVGPAGAPVCGWCEAVESRDFTTQWYAVRLERLKQLAKERGCWPEMASIIANGTADCAEPHDYECLLQAAKYRAKKAEAERDELRVRLQTWDDDSKQFLLDTAAKAVADRDAALAENATLRGIATKVLPCHYCGVTDLAACPHGFPGCALADDMVAGEAVLATALATARAELAAANARIDAALASCNAKACDGKNTATLGQYRQGVADAARAIRTTLRGKPPEDNP